MELSVASNQAIPCIPNMKNSRYLYVFLPNFVDRTKWPPPPGGGLGTCFEQVVRPVPHGPQEAGARHIDACRGFTNMCVRLSASTSGRWRCAPSKLPAATLAMPRCFLNCSIRFPAIGRSVPSPPMAPLTHARATTLSPDVGPMLSFRYARTPSPGRPTPSVPGHETTSCAPQNIWDGHGGDGGTVVIAEAAPKRR